MTAPTEELPQIPAAASERAHDAITALHFVALTSSQVVSKAAMTFGIAPADLRALFFLNVEPGATPKRVAAHMGLTTGAVTSLVDRLVDGELAAREPNPADRRSVILVLSERGREAVAEVTRLYNAAFLDSIDPAEMSALAERLSALSAALDDQSHGKGI